MTPIPSYPPNNLIRLAGQFYDINNNLADPTVVILWVGGPDGTFNQLNPVRDGIGLYHYDYTTATPGGKWFFRYQGLGAVKAQSSDTPFNIQLPQF